MKSNSLFLFSKRKEVLGGMFFILLLTFVNATTIGNMNSRGLNIIVPTTNTISTFNETYNSLCINYSLVISSYNITYHNKADYNFSNNNFNGSGNITTFGKIGIGNSNPLYGLDYQGTGVVLQRILSNNIGRSIIRFSRDTRTNWDIGTNVDGLGTNNFMIREETVPVLVLENTTRNVGLGTLKPDTKLTVNGSVNITQNLIILGNLSVKRPYGIFSSTQTQTIAVANTPYPITFNWTEDSYEITKSSDNSNFTLQQTGDYLIELSAVFVTDTNNKHVEIWVQKTNTSGTMVNIPRSNTKVEIPNAGTEIVVGVPFIIDLNQSERFRIMFASDDAGSQMLYTTNTSYSPETPSIIMTLTKISELTP